MEDMMDIKVLGSGCANCKKLEANTKEALASLGMDITVDKVQDFKEIAKYGVMRTPALVIDGEVKLVGKVAAKEEIQELLKK